MEFKEETLEMIEDELLSLIYKLEGVSSRYYNSENIINDFMESLKRNCEGQINRCLNCGIDMGRSNPRQLCEKTYCPY